MASMASFSVNFSSHNDPSNIVKARGWLRNHFPIIFIWGLVLSHSIVEYTTSCILMLYLTNREGKDLALAATIINSLDILSAGVFVYIAAYIRENFSAIVFSTGSYTMGLIVLWITASKEFNMIYLAVVLIAIGKSSRPSNLGSFLKYQLRRDVSTKIWWHSAWICGYVIALFVHDHDYEYQWLNNFKISALLMGATSMLFFNINVSYAILGPGIGLQGCEKPAERLSLDRVLKFFKLKGDKANKLLLWATFIPYGLVLATGYTLFITQINNMDNRIGNNFTVPAQFFFVVKSFTCDMVVFLWYCCRSRRATRTITLVRIGAGMVCGVFCCVAARQIEILRQNRFHEEGVLEDPSITSSLSVLLLTPQYCLLGLMEGLGGGGLFTYILSRLKGSRRRSAEPFCELVFCVGKLLSIPFVHIFRFWFEHTDNSKLDRYFLMLAIISSAFFCLYIWWALNFDDLETNSDHDQSESAVSEVEKAQPVQQDGDQVEEQLNEDGEYLETIVDVTSTIEDNIEDVTEENQTEKEDSSFYARNNF